MWLTDSYMFSQMEEKMIDDGCVYFYKQREWLSIILREYGCLNLDLGFLSIFLWNRHKHILTYLLLDCF